MYESMFDTLCEDRARFAELLVISEEEKKKKHAAIIEKDRYISSLLNDLRKITNANASLMRAAGNVSKTQDGSGMAAKYGFDHASNLVPDGGDHE